MFHTIVMALHVLGAGVMLGVVLLAFFVAFNKTFDLSRLSLLKNFYLLGTVGAMWQIVTGLILYFQEDGKFAGSKIFWIKIILFVLDGTIAVAVVDRRVKAAAVQNKSEVSLGNTRSWALVSLFLITTIIILGVFLSAN